MLVVAALLVLVVAAVLVFVDLRKPRKPKIPESDSKRAHPAAAQTLPESRPARELNLSHVGLFPGPVSVTSALFEFSNLCYLFFIKFALPDAVPDAVPNPATWRFSSLPEPLSPKPAACAAAGDAFFIKFPLPRPTLPLFLMEVFFAVLQRPTLASRAVGLFL